MKLIVQRVTSATVEVDGYVESRIGSGLVLNLVLTPGDSIEKAHRLAKKIVKLNLWPEVMNPQQMWRTNVVENGCEILVILQQTLCSTFKNLVPMGDGAMNAVQAKSITESFVKMLQAEYQEEMVICAPNDANRRIEVVSEGPCLFELEADMNGVAPSRAQPATTVTPGEVEPEIVSVTKALRRMPQLAKTKATLESVKIFRLFSMKKFRAALANAEQHEVDAFAEALDSAAGYFNKKQQEQISAWTGLRITAPPIEDSVEDDMLTAKAEFPDELTEEVDGLDEKLAALKDEVENPGATAARKRPRPPVKNEFFDPNGEAGARTRPDWTGRAAPNTPAVSARQWVANRSGGIRPLNRADGKSLQPWSAGKGNGKGPRPNRSMGIVSLDESNRLHGNQHNRFAFGQQAQYSDPQLGSAQDEGENERGAKALKLPKGMPTLAPMTPGPNDIIGEI